MGSVYLFLRFHSTLEISLHARLKVLDFLPLESLQLRSHQSAHILEQQATLMHPALCIPDIGLHLAEAVLLGATCTQQLLLRRLEFREGAFGRVP